jgi:pyruvate,orthophosphate dikinase
MIPLTLDKKELKILDTATRNVADAIIKDSKVKLEYLVGTMIELPRAALLADQIAQVAEFFSFGTNDLTQTTMGLSRDDAGRFLPEYVDQSKAAIFKDDPFQSIDVEGVGMLIKWAIEKGRKTRPKLNRHLRRAWRRRRKREVLPQRRHELRERLALPRANRPPGSGSSGN